LVPKFAGSHPAEKILSTPSFGGEVKPSVPRRSFTACKRSLNVTLKRHLGKIARYFSPTVPPSAAGCSRVVTRGVVAKVGTSYPDRTVSLKGCSA